jgi:phosphoglycerate kinase
VAIIGGAKVSSKMGVLKHLITKVDNILIGGGMAYTFLKAKGLNIGNSLIEKELLSEAFQIIDRANYNECGFFLPDDHVIANEYSEKAKSLTTSGLEIPDGWMGMDIGPKTIKKYQKILKDANTILWNGPMGVFEMTPFSKGTFSIAKSVAKNKGVTVVGGGDSIFAVKQSGVEGQITHISTGGGATLEFLEGKKLPGVEALRKSS